MAERTDENEKDRELEKMYGGVEHAVKLHGTIQNLNNMTKKTPCRGLKNSVRICQVNEEDNIELKI